MGECVQFLLSWCVFWFLLSNGAEMKKHPTWRNSRIIRHEVYEIHSDECERNCYFETMREPWHTSEAADEKFILFVVFEANVQKLRRRKKKLCCDHANRQIIFCKLGEKVLDLLKFLAERNHTKFYLLIMHLIHTHTSSSFVASIIVLNIQKWIELDQNNSHTHVWCHILEPRLLRIGLTEMLIRNPLLIVVDFLNQEQNNDDQIYI